MDPLTIINGCVLFAAQKRDGSTQEVEILQLPIRKLERFAVLQGDEAALVEYVCDQPTGWDDEITLDSHLEILRIGEELNADPFAKWIQRLKARVESATGTTASLLSSLPKGFVPPAITPVLSSPTSRPLSSSGPIADTSSATPS